MGRDRLRCRFKALAVTAALLGTVFLSGGCGEGRNDQAGPSGRDEANAASKDLAPSSRPGDMTSQDSAAMLAQAEIAKAEARYQRDAEGGDIDAMLALARAYRDHGRFESAAAWYRMAADREHAPAMTQLGLLHETGQGVPLNHAKAVAIYRDAARLGDTDAMMRLAAHYTDGVGVERDDDVAIDWMKKAAEAGNLDAMFTMGAVEYSRTPGATSHAWWRRAAEAGHVPSMVVLGAVLCKAQSRSATLEAEQWLHKAAEQGNTQAAALLADLYYGGRMGPGRITDAMPWYLKAANAGDAHAMQRLGMMYMGVTDIEEDADKAIAWFTRAAEAGSVPAMHGLGLIYDGSIKGRTPNYPEAVRWYGKAREAGSALATTRLARLYELGLGVSKDQARALELYREAATKGVPDAMRWMGDAYDTGDGVPQDRAKAMDWWRQAAHALNWEASYKLGMAYAAGYDGERDYDKAYEHISISAFMGGHADAMFALALLLDRGQGVTTDHEAATAWLRSAAARGQTDAMAHLAHRYEVGAFVTLDHVEACAWAIVMQRHDKSKATPLLDRLRNQLTDDQRAAATRRAAAIQAELDAADKAPPATLMQHGR